MSLEERRMAAAKAIDRRRSPRVESIHLVTFEAEGAEGIGGTAVEVGRTLDVSVSGVRVETAIELDAGRELDLDVAVAERLIRAQGRVIHAEPMAPDRWEIGIQFTRIEPDDLELLVASRG
jgi:hypothetical protein